MNFGSPVTTRDVIRAACDLYGITESELCGKTRSFPLRLQRHATIAAARIVTRDSLSSIAGRFGRTSADVAYSVRRAKEDPLLGEDAAAIAEHATHGPAQLPFGAG